MTYAVLTHHKCASNWLASYSKDVARLNGLSIEVSHQCNVSFDPSPDITVLLNSNYAVEKAANHQGLHLIRNPLDILISAYFSHLNTHATDQWPQLKVQRELLRSLTREEGMMMTIPFLERADFDYGVIGPFIALRLWDFSDTCFETVLMEDAVADVEQTIGRAFRTRFGADLRLPKPHNYTFERFSGGRRAGHLDEASHYRSGLAGDGARQLPVAAIRYVQIHLRDMLELFYPLALTPPSGRRR